MISKQDFINHNNFTIYYIIVDDYPNRYASKDILTF